MSTPSLDDASTNATVTEQHTAIWALNWSGLLCAYAVVPLYQRGGITPSGLSTGGFSASGLSTGGFRLLAGVLGVAALTLLALSLCLYRTERFTTPQNAAEALQQVRNRADQPVVNEVLLLAVLGSASLALGVGRCLYQGDAALARSSAMDLTTILLVSAGWFSYGLAAATPDTSLKQLNRDRLAWTLPGVALLSASTLWTLDAGEVGTTRAEPAPSLLYMLGGLLLVQGHAARQRW
jgi:hypothetical protein